MNRLFLTAGLLAGLTFPALADEPPPGAQEAFVPRGYGSTRAASPHAYARPPRAYRHRVYAMRSRPLVAAVQPVSYGEPSGDVYQAWMPRNDKLPIYNIPPPFFPEW